MWAGPPRLSIGCVDGISFIALAGDPPSSKDEFRDILLRARNSTRSPRLRLPAQWLEAEGAYVHHGEPDEHKALDALRTLDADTRDTFWIGLDKARPHQIAKPDAFTAFLKRLRCAQPRYETFDDG